jgi:hypothetical protein
MWGDTQPIPHPPPRRPTARFPRRRGVFCPGARSRFLLLPVVLKGNGWPVFIERVREKDLCVVNLAAPATLRSPARALVPQRPAHRRARVQPHLAAAAPVRAVAATPNQLGKLWHYLIKLCRCSQPAHVAPPVVEWSVVRELWEWCEERKNNSCKLFEKIISPIFSRKKMLLTDIHFNNTKTV